MVTFLDAKKLITSKYQNKEITEAIDVGDKYVFTLYPKNYNKGELLLDPYYSVDKATGSVNEYSPLFGMEKFKEATKHPLYKKKTEAG